MAAPFSCPLQELNEFRELSQALAKGRGPLLLSGCVDSERVHLLGEAAAGLPLRLWITYSDQRAEQLADDARCFGSEALVYPAKDLLFYQADVHGSLLMRRRLAVVKNLLENGSGTIVTTIDALMERLAPAETFLTQILEFETGAVIDSEETIRRFSSMGYERTAKAEQAGKFAVRGGILDIFPLTEENPVRIELWGDEIDSIRTYDAETQRSLEELPSVRIFPAGEPET